MGVSGEQKHRKADYKAIIMLRFVSELRKKMNAKNGTGEIFI